MLAGSEARRRAHPDQYRDPDLSDVSRNRWRLSARARWASSSRHLSPALRNQSHVFEMLPRIVPVEDEEISKELERFQEAGIRVETGARVENVQNVDSGVQLPGDSGNGKRRSFGSRNAAGRRRPQAQHREHRPGKHQGGTRSRLHQGGPLPAHRRARRLRHRRHRGGTLRSWRTWPRREGMVAVAHIAGKPAMPINRNRIPGCTYTEPGIGSVGLTEAQARAAGYASEGRQIPVRGRQPRPPSSGSTMAS